MRTFDPPNLAPVEANNSIGSHGSGIEALDLPNSRTRRMLRPPTASGAGG